MFNFLKTATLLLTLCFAGNLRAQAVSDADQKGIQECYNAFMTAFEKMDASAISPWLTENAEQINPMGEIVRGHSNLVTHFGNLFNFFKTQPKADRFERKTSDWNARYLASDLILATYASEEITQYGDKTNTEKMSVAVLLRKKGDKWLAELITLTPVTPMPGAGK